MQVAGMKVLIDFNVIRGRAHLPLPTTTRATAFASVGDRKNMCSSLPGRIINEQLAHELMLDPYFRIDDKGGSADENPVLSRIRERFQVAFWESFVSDLRLSPPCYERVVRVIYEIKDSIANVVNRPKEATNINDVVHVDTISKEVKVGKVECSECVRLMRA